VPRYCSTLEPGQPAVRRSVDAKIGFPVAGDGIRARASSFRHVMPRLSVTGGPNFTQHPSVFDLRVGTIILTAFYLLLAIVTTS
jgi:hypothetical protein